MDSSDPVPGDGRPPRVPMLGRACPEGSVHHQYRASYKHDLRVQHEPHWETATVRISHPFAHLTPFLYVFFLADIIV